MKRPRAVSSSGLLFSLSRPERNMRKTLIRSETGERLMRCNAGIVCLVLAAGLHATAAQPFPASDTLTPQQLQGQSVQSILHGLPCEAADHLARQIWP